MSLDSGRRWGIVLVENQCPNQSGTSFRVPDTHGNILLTKGIRLFSAWKGGPGNLPVFFRAYRLCYFEQPWGAQNK